MAPWIVLATVAVVLGSLMFTSLSADAVLFGGVSFLVVVGILDAKTAFQGLANEGMLTVGALFIVAEGLRQTGAVTRLSSVLLGDPKNVRRSLARMMFPVAGASAFLNNTPIVAALMPAVTEWSRRNQVAASKFLMPLSYATILGGTISMIGTSTNLVVSGMIAKNLDQHEGLRTLGIFDITPVGLPLALLGCVVILALGPILLPDRRPAISRTDDPREYTVELLVQAGSSLVGATVESAGLRNLPGGFLIEIDRADEVLAAVEPRTRLRAGDRLVFAGPREMVVDLKRLPGLIPAPDQIFKLQGPETERSMVEAVVASGNPLLGRSIKEGGFRSTFDAVVVAVARDGQRVTGRIGDIVLEVGDVLLLEAAPDWASENRDRRDFYLVSAVEDSASFRHDRAWVALALLALMVGAAATELTSMFQASLVAAFAMVATGCLAAIDARRSIDWTVLIAIASALGLGEAIRVSGLDVVLVAQLAKLGADDPWTAMVVVYVGTAVLTELITNNAAAALMFPFALTAADKLGVSPMPLVVAVMFAASASFATPIGYQTNLMVYGPGGYRFTDYLRLGLVLQVTAAVVSIMLIPLTFPF
jgi:di/tricarboxylate transporter